MALSCSTPGSRTRPRELLSSFPCLCPSLKSGGPPALRDTLVSQRDTLRDKVCSHRARWGLCPSSPSLRMEGDKDGQTEGRTDPRRCVTSIISFPDPRGAAGG